ncbi:MAG: glycosyltransferase family 4 protein [Phycisphaerae bacterium]|nr:glycosyltransferase family 4 protein [Phycisphaerae bacterium]
MTDQKLQIIGAAFGRMDTDKTFSGVARHLFSEIKKRGLLAGFINTKQLHIADSLEGMVDIRRILKFRRPGISPLWMWRPETIEKLGRRFEKQLRNYPDNYPVLQIGTHVLVPDEYTHFCFTDMTIFQAANAHSHFDVSRLNYSRLIKAINMQKKIFENCDAIMTPSDWTRDSVIDDYGIEPSKVHVVGNGTSVQLPNVTALRKEPDILFIGRNWVRKGGPILLEAFNMILEDMPNATLTIIGCNPKIRKHPNIRVMGLLDKTKDHQRQILESCFLRTSVLCVPSLFEPFGICFVEAQAYGLPVVTFDGEGRSNALLDQISGLLLRQRSPAALSAVLLDLLFNPQKAADMGKTGQRYVTNNLTWEKVADKSLDIIGSYADKEKIETFQ